MNITIKKKFALIIAAALLIAVVLTGCAASTVAQQETNQQETGQQTDAAALSLTVTGAVTDITNENGSTVLTVDSRGIIKADAVYDMMIINITPDVKITDATETETLSEKDIEIGDVVQVFFDANAPVTASEPPQGTPSKIVVMDDDIYKFDGTITEINEDGENILIYVKEDEDSKPEEDITAVVSASTLIINKTDTSTSLSSSDLKTGMEIEVTSDGTMTKSIPGQVNAVMIIID